MQNSTYAHKLFKICNMQIEMQDPQIQLADWQVINLIKLLLQVEKSNAFVKFSLSDILTNEQSPYFCISSEGSCIAANTLSEAIAGHVLSCMHILEITQVKEALKC